jgi:hypothetical protein
VRKFALAVMAVGALALPMAGVASKPVPVSFTVVEFFDGSPGTFASDGSVVCATGTTSNQTFASGFQSNLGAIFHVRKTITCGDGSGTFVLQIQAQVGIRGPDAEGPWTVLSGTGDYATLRGAGGVVGAQVPGGVSDVYTGWLSLR